MTFTVDIASLTDREELVAEIWLENTMMAEIRRIDGSYLVEIYPREDGRPWIFDIECWQEALTQAKKKLF